MYMNIFQIRFILYDTLNGGHMATKGIEVVIQEGRAKKLYPNCKIDTSECKESFIINCHASDITNYSSNKQCDHSWDR